MIQRRAFLKAGAVAGLAAVSGCLTDARETAPPLPSLQETLRESLVFNTASVSAGTITVTLVEDPQIKERYYNSSTNTTRTRYHSCIPVVVGHGYLGTQRPVRDEAPTGNSFRPPSTEIMSGAKTYVGDLTSGLQLGWYVVGARLLADGREQGWELLYLHVAGESAETAAMNWTQSKLVQPEYRR